MLEDGVIHFTGHQQGVSATGKATRSMAYGKLTQRLHNLLEARAREATHRSRAMHGIEQVRDLY